MSSNNVGWMADGKIISFGGIDLSYDPESVIDKDELISPVLSLKFQNEVTMTISLTSRQMENLWIVYHNLRLKLAPCPSKRVYHNAFKHHKARVREKNRKRAERMIERMYHT